MKVYKSDENEDRGMDYYKKYGERFNLLRRPKI